MPSSAAPSRPTAPPPSAAWSDAELKGDPHAHAAKADKVRGMFAAIAHAYDLNNRLHSFGMDQAWRRAAVRLADPKTTDVALDCACGTGDLTRALADGGAARVTGLDFTAEMLDIARTKRLAPKRSPRHPNIDYIQGDAMALPFADASFDIVTIAFGLRNVSDPARALAEFRRVLRPGGRLVILEFDEPRNRVVRALNRVYCTRIMPWTATVISRDRSGAYKYLPRSVRTFLDREALARAVREAGFQRVTQRALTMGVCVITRGVIG
jgi:demethylmenaquinone methyltransferase/2-methoxy-6-polyprenyl-1,4-benzoquinol methylase